MADTQHFAQVMLDHDDGGAAAVDLGDGVGEQARLLRVQSGERLIQQQQLGCERKRAGQFQPLEYAHGLDFRRFVRMRLDSQTGQQLAPGSQFPLAPRMEQRFHRRRGLVGAGCQRHVVDQRHAAKRRHDLLRQGQPAPYAQVCRQAIQRLAIQQHRAAGRPHHPRDDPQHGGLAGAVRADQAQQFTLLHVEGYVADRGNAVEEDGDRAYRQQCAHFAPRRSAWKMRATSAAIPPGLKRIIRNNRPP